MPVDITNGSLSEAQFAAWVEELGRAFDGKTQLLGLLDEQHSIYEGRDSQTIVRMRGWIMVLLARGELPEGALPFVLEELETSVNAYLVAAAALALRSYPRPNPILAPFLLRALKNIQVHDSPVVFSGYGEYAAGANASCAVQELLLTAGWMGGQAKAIVPELASLRQSRTLSPRLLNHLDHSLAAINGAEPVKAEEADEDCCKAFLGLGRHFRLPSLRENPETLGKIILEDQDGHSISYREFFHGQPSIVAFFYTRCDNPLKCSLTIWKMARVQKLIEERNLTSQIRTAAVTYDSAYDLPERLRLYGKNRNLRMDANNRLLRAVDGIAPLRSYFKLGVSFMESLVNRHRIEVFLLDRHGRIAESFQRLHWDETKVVEQAVALLTESVGSSRKFTWKALPFSGPLAALLIAIMPKCPVCWAAYLSAFGLTAFAGSASHWVYLVVIALLALNLGSIFWRSRSTRQWLGFYFSLTGTIFLVLNLCLSLPGTVWIGIGLLTVGSIFNSLGKQLGILKKRFSNNSRQTSV